MSAPHHHVFNAMQREIYRSVMVEPLLPILRDRGVISPEQNKLFKENSKNNIKILVGILRNQTFETFLSFIECICIAHESPEGEGKVEKPIVVSMRNVVEDFDLKHNTEYVKSVDEIIDRYMKTATFLEQTTEEEHTTVGEKDSVLSVKGDTASLVPVMASLDIPEPTGPGDTLLLPTLPYISEPAVRSFTHSGDHLYDEDLDLSLSVPPGTVSENETLKLKVGACCYGPFSVPDRYLVVTAFYCIVAHQKLQKPVKVEMGHCLLMPQYQKSRSVHILKADHQTVSTSDRHIFEHLTHPKISNDRPYLSFEIQDFSILCGVVETKSEEQGSQPLKTIPATLDNLPITSDGRNMVQKFEHFGLLNDRDMGCQSTSLDMQQLEQSSLDQLYDTDRDARGPSSGKQHSGTVAVPHRHQLKRQRSIDYDSPATHHCRVEYAVLLFEPQNVTSSPFSFFIFVCEYFPVAIEECRKQAKELGFHHPPQLLQVKFTDSEIKFVPDTSDIHAEIKTKATPVVKENQIHADMKQLRDEKVSPPRVEFEVSYDHQLHDATHCRIDVQGVECSDFKAACFEINIPSVAPLCITAETTDLEELPIVIGSNESENSTVPLQEDEVFDKTLISDSMSESNPAEADGSKVPQTVLPFTATAETIDLEELPIYIVPENSTVPLQDNEVFDDTDSMSESNPAEADGSKVPQTVLPSTAISTPSLCSSTYTAEERAVQPPLFVGGIESQTFTQTGGIFSSHIHGISVDIPKQAIPSHISSFEIKMRVCLHGPFVFPYPDVEICSAVVCLSCEPSFHFVSDVTVEIPHCAIIDSDSDHKDFFVLRAPDSANPHWKFSEVLDSEISTCHVTIKVRHFSKVTLAYRQKELLKSRKKRHKMKKLKEHSLDSHMKYKRQSSLDSRTSDLASAITRERASSSPAPLSRAGSEDDVLCSGLSEFVVVCCAPQERPLLSWKVAFVVSYSHPTGLMVAKQTAQSVLGCSSLGRFDPVYFTFDEELLRFEPAEWKQDGWEVIATKTNQIPRAAVVQCKELPQREQVDICPRLVYIIIKGTSSSRPLTCKIDVKGANSDGQAVFFLLTSPDLGMQREETPGAYPARQEEISVRSRKTLNVQNLSRVLVQVTDWHTLGITLGVLPHKLKTIEKNHPLDTERCRNEMLTMWLQMLPTPRWRNIVKALHDMDYHALAKKVHREYVHARPRQLH